MAQIQSSLSFLLNNILILIGGMAMCFIHYNIVLENFNLSIPAGKTLALVGRSGGGKSTIKKCFPENIAYGLSKSDYTQEDLIQAAKKAQAYDFILQMKDGFQTRIGERGNRISGGQRQRIAIARVFLRKPKIILLDEATSALDEHSQEAVQKALSVLITESHATVVLVAHRLSTVMNAHSIVVIDNGRVLEQGTHNELVVQDGIYASMVQKQNKKMTDELDQKDKIDIGDL